MPCAATQALQVVVLMVLLGTSLSADASDSSEIIECKDEDVTELALDQQLRCQATGDEPRVFCYDAPQFNIWRAFCEVNFEVVSQDGEIPFVHLVGEDSLHGIVDKHVKVLARSHTLKFVCLDFGAFLHFPPHYSDAAQAKRKRKALDEGVILPDDGVDTLVRKRAIRRASASIRFLPFVSFPLTPLTLIHY